MASFSFRRINKWQEEINKELEEQKKAAIFKANEPKVKTWETWLHEVGIQMINCKVLKG